ncbi:MAG: 30S ribosomal protein S27ae [Thermoprotei archaeon]|nr:MAG: 30S ribosomal protein S27ae [Thermoprotei archaeon]RLF01055.1 MAG: 30S ribosomal protein S27ae [Thermoprotei archaeon]HDI74316.1 30S ribosomal protein S27ae [Thermoprotei archaeon]
MAHVHKLYEYDYEKGYIRLKNKKCPRCGSIMAHHLQPVERHHCGRCGYTIFVAKKGK